MAGKREQDIRLKLEIDPPSDVEVTEKGGSTSEKLFRSVRLKPGDASVVVDRPTHQVLIFSATQ